MPQFTPQATRPVTQQPGDQPTAFAAAFANGGHVVVWNSTPSSDRSTWGAYAQLYDAQGNRTGGPIALFTQLGGWGDIGVAAGGVAALADGSFVVTARAQRFGADPYPWDWVFWSERHGPHGELLGAPQAIGEPFSAYDYPSASAGPAFTLPGGSSYVVELDANTRYTPLTWASATLQRYGPDGTAQGQRMSDSALGFGPDAAVLAGGNVVIAKADGRYAQSLYVTAFDASGNPAGESTVTAAPFGATNHLMPEVAALASGQALVVWRYSEATAGQWTGTWQSQRVDAAAQWVGERHALPIDVTAGVQLVSLAGGGVIAWWDSGAGFQALSIDESGRADGSAFFIGPGVVSVDATADGGFVVASVREGNGSGLDIYEQKFEPAGGIAIIASPGLDQISFPGDYAQYTVTLDSITGPEGTHSLAGIERLHFADGLAVALDIDGHAGQAYRLYQAAFDRVPDLPGVGYQMNDLDTWLTLPQVAANFIASPEFQRQYGSVGNDGFVTLLYRNVLDREPEAAGFQYHLDRLAAGATRADILVGFSESPENQAKVIGQIGDGILYVPVGG